MKKQYRIFVPQRRNVMELFIINYPKEQIYLHTRQTLSHGRVSCILHGQTHKPRPTAIQSRPMVTSKFNVSVCIHVFCYKEIHVKNNMHSVGRSATPYGMLNITLMFNMKKKIINIWKSTKQSIRMFDSKLKNIKKKCIIQGKIRLEINLWIYLNTSTLFYYIILSARIYLKNSDTIYINMFQSLIWSFWKFSKKF